MGRSLSGGAPAGAAGRAANADRQRRLNLNDIKVLIFHVSSLALSTQQFHHGRDSPPLPSILCSCLTSSASSSRSTLRVVLSDSLLLLLFLLSDHIVLQLVADCSSSLLLLLFLLSDHIVLQLVADGSSSLLLFLLSITWFYSW